MRCRGRKPRRVEPVEMTGVDPPVVSPEGAREVERGETRSDVPGPRCGREYRNAAETACRER